MAYDEQYDDPKLWTLVSADRGKDYQSVPTEVPQTWERKRTGPSTLTYTSGDYEIKQYGSTPDRRTYTVWRLGIELPLSFCGRLMDAKARAVRNAQGRDRMHLA